MKFHFESGLDYWVTIAGLLIYKLPVFLGHNQSSVVRMICLFPFFVVIVKNYIYLTKNRRYEFDKRLFFIFMLYLSILGVACLRSGLSDYYSLVPTLGKFVVWATFAFFGFFVFARNNSEDKIKYFRETIYYGLILYGAVNAITYLMGFTNQEELYVAPRPAIMLQFFDITMARVLLPFSSGINTEGFISGAGLTASVLLLLYGPEKKEKVIGLIGTGFSTFVLLLSDSRGALLFAAITILTSIVFQSGLIQYWRWLPLSTPVLTLMLLFIQRIIPFEFIQGLVRTPLISEVEILSGRQQIWGSILAHFSDFQITHLFGYGYRGQVISGLSQSYAYLFSNYINSDTAAGHNYILQTLIEIGYTGLIVALWLITSMMFSLAKLVKINPEDHTQKILFALLFYMVLGGITETVLTPDHQELFYIFILIWASIGASLPKCEPEEQEPDEQFVTDPVYLN